MKNILPAVVVLLLGLSLRIYGLSTESLWIDEGTSIQLARSSLAHIIENRSQSVNPPLYFIVLHYWVRLFGQSEFSIRLPSVIFGSLAIPMIYKLGRLIFDKRIGILSGFLLATSLFHINYSQEARGFSLMAVLALISMYFFVKLLGDRSLTSLIGYVCASILLMYTHFYGLLIILVQDIFFVSTIIFSNNERKSNFREWILTQGLLAVLYTPWIGFLITQMIGIQDGYWIPTPTAASILLTFLAYAAKSRALLLCFLGLSLLAVLAPRRTVEKPNPKTRLESANGSPRTIGLSDTAKIWLLVLWLAVPIVLPFVVSQLTTPIYYTRYTIAASLAFYILIAKGVQEIPNRTLKSMVIASLIIFSLPNISGYYTRVDKQQWRDLADYMHKNAETGDLILFNAGGIKDSAFAYYFDRDDLTQKPYSLDIDPATEDTSSDRHKGTEGLEATVRGYDRVWLVLAHSNDRQGIIKNKLGELYYLAYQHQYVGIELYLFEKPRQLVTQEIRYHAPGAGAVVLTWGVNGWTAIPKTGWPVGTTGTDGLLRTPMIRQGDIFVAKVQVPAGVAIDYAFHITRMHSGAAADVWDTNNGQDYHTTASYEGVIEVQAGLTLVQDQTPAGAADTPLVSQEIHYYMPEAQEVVLLWGVDDWAIVPEGTGQAGTVVKDRVMQTPMISEDDTFVANIQVPVGTTIDYGFLITKTRNGRAVEVWEADGEQDLHTIAAQNDPIEIRTKLTSIDDRTPLLVSSIEPPLLAAIGITAGIAATLILRRIPAPSSLKPSPRRQQTLYLYDLLRELIIRDMKLRYKRSVLGILWSLLNPLFQMVVFTFLSRRVLSLDIPNYPSFVFTGLLAWNWFQTTVTLATGAITSNRELIRRPGFPVAILPVVTVTTNLIHFVLALPVLLVFLVLSGGTLSVTILALPLVILLQFVLSLGLGYLVATLQVTFRDTQHILGVFFMLLFYLTPVFYDASIVSGRFQTLYQLNPILHLISAYRAILIQGNLPDFGALLALGALGGLLLWLGHTVFTRASYRFVEEL